ncbi:MAG: hypothetical protein MJZ33_11180 [Paludibacteraceae bacterium]|nr:hypothetical protein [Paludibacteraceae bacterium]
MVTEDELNEMMRLMTESLDPKDKPCVGIFWYSPARNELFGVVKAKKGDKNYVSSGFGGMATCRDLHKDVWKKEYNKNKFKDGSKINLFIGDYKDKPRGRIFYSESKNHYIIMVGSWVDEYEAAKQCIIDEFKLNGHCFEFVKNIHWEIGNGFGD